MFVKVHRELPLPGDELLFELQIDGFKLSGRGSVRWTIAPVASNESGDNSQAGFGVQFLNLDEAAKDFIQNYLSTRKS